MDVGDECQGGLEITTANVHFQSRNCRRDFTAPFRLFFLPFVPEQRFSSEGENEGEKKVNL
jgi:hypothetical protein